MMMPVDGAELPPQEKVRRAWVNGRNFDRAAFGVWLRGQPGSTQRVAAVAPPWRLYKVHGAWAVVAGYGGAWVTVRLLEADTELAVPADALVPVDDVEIHAFVTSTSPDASLSPSITVFSEREWDELVERPNAPPQALIDLFK